MYPILLPNLIIFATQKALQLQKRRLQSDKVSTIYMNVCLMSGRLPLSEEVIYSHVKWVSVSSYLLEPRRPLSGHPEDREQRRKWYQRVTNHSSAA